MSIWIRDHLDPCLRELLSPNGPFADCTHTERHRNSPHPHRRYRPCPPPRRHDRPHDAPGQRRRRGPRGAAAARRAPPHHHHHNHEPRRRTRSDQRRRAAPAGPRAAARPQRAARPRLPGTAPGLGVGHPAGRVQLEPRRVQRDRTAAPPGSTNSTNPTGPPQAAHPGPPPRHHADAPVFQPEPHLQLAIPFLCANLRTATAHLAATGKPASPLDALLVCHIAGCGRVTRLPHRHPHPRRSRLRRRAAPRPCTATSPPCTPSSTASPNPQDPRRSAACPPPRPTPGPQVPAAPSPTPPAAAASPPPCATPSTKPSPPSAPPGPDQTAPRGQLLGPPHLEPASDHSRGRACDLFPTRAGTFPTGTDLANGWHLATWLRAHADALHISYLIWQGRYWSPPHPTPRTGDAPTTAAASTTSTTPPAATTTTSTPASPELGHIRSDDEIRSPEIGRQCVDRGFTLPACLDAPTATRVLNCGFTRFLTAVASDAMIPSSS